MLRSRSDSRHLPRRTVTHSSQLPKSEPVRRSDPVPGRTQTHRVNRHFAYNLYRPNNWNNSARFRVFFPDAALGWTLSALRQVGTAWAEFRTKTESNVDHATQVFNRLARE
ncbi:hypothetical protein JCM17478_01450 [Thermopirellula anaerolimosa]